MIIIMNTCMILAMWCSTSDIKGRISLSLFSCCIRHVLGVWVRAQNCIGLCVFRPVCMQQKHFHVQLLILCRNLHHRFDDQYHWEITPKYILYTWVYTLSHCRYRLSNPSMHIMFCRDHPLFKSPWIYPSITFNQFSPKHSCFSQGSTLSGEQ